MRIKQKWEKNLKILRKEEINYLDEILKDYDKFQIGLELGCGDGYQSQFLKKYCRKNLLIGKFFISQYFFMT